MPIPQILPASHSSMSIGTNEALDSIPNPFLLLTLYFLSLIALSLMLQMSPKKFGTFEIAYRFCICGSEVFDWCNSLVRGSKN